MEHPRVPAPRASDRDRESVVERLRDAAADGRLTFEEFEDRMAQAYAARTLPQLEPLLADLPDDRSPALAETPTTPDVIRGSFATVQRTGHWVVPRVLEVRLKGSSAHLDLTEASFPHVVDVVVTLSASSMNLVVPRGTRVDASGISTSLGAVSDRTQAGDADDRCVRLRGHSTMSAITVKHPGRVVVWWADVRRFLRAG